MVGFIFSVDRESVSKKQRHVEHWHPSLRAEKLKLLLDILGMNGIVQ